MKYLVLINLVFVVIFPLFFKFLKLSKDPILFLDNLTPSLYRFFRWTLIVLGSLSYFSIFLNIPAKLIFENGLLGIFGIVFGTVMFIQSNRINGNVKLTKHSDYLK